MSFMVLLQTLLKLLPLILQILGGIGVGSSYSNYSSGAGFGDPYVGVQGGISAALLVGAPGLWSWIEKLGPSMVLSYLSPDVLKRAEFAFASAKVLRENAEVNAMFRELHGCDIPTEPKAIIHMVSVIKNDVARLR